MRFVIFSPMYNNSKHIDFHMKSVLNQTYKNFKHIVIDDASQDDTYKILQNHLYENVTIIKNEKNIKWVENAITYLPKEANEEDVIVCLDGDDWFSHNKVLERLNMIYGQEDCWLTYGQFEPTNPKWPGYRCKYVKNTIENRTFRKDKWVFSHLKTFKAFLFFSIKQKDLKIETGTFTPFTYDVAIMLPMLEMCPPEKIRFIDEVLYIYNTDNIISIEKNYKHKQKELAKMFKSREKYSIISRPGEKI